VDHDGAVRVFDDDVDADGAAFLVMELLLGETLDDRRRRRGGKLPCREVLALGHQLLDVLAAAHERGIVHRDVKPENLFLTTDRVLKVLDFGIARMKDDAGSLATATGARIGTPAYMPPEQALGRTSEVDARTDLWAAGATLFALLAGRTVHDAQSAAEVIVITATTPARSLAELAPDLPRPVVDAVDRALQFTRDARWPDARSMQQALAAAHLQAFGEAVVKEDVGSLPVPQLTVAKPDSDVETLPLQAARATTDVTPPSTSKKDDDVASAPTWQSDRGKPSPPKIDPTLSPATLSARPPPVHEIPPESKPIEMSHRRWPWTVGMLIVAVAGSFGLATWLARAPDPAGASSSVTSATATTANAGTGSAAPTSGCTSHRECTAANAGAASICRKPDGACVALASEHCKVLASPGDVENDATLWIGAMFPHGTPDPMHYGPQSANAIELARRDFAETTGGLLPARPGGPKRPIGVVLCDDLKVARPAAEHLVRDLRVPAILGFARSSDVLELGASLFVPRGVLALAANTATAIRDLPRGPDGQRLVWRVTIGTDAFVPGEVALLSDFIEGDLRAQPGALAPGEPMRVALVRTAGAAGQSYSDGFVGKLRFNGKSVAENGAQFRQILAAELPDINDSSEDARLAAEVRAFLPAVILIAGGGIDFVAEVEKVWPADASFRPRYLGANNQVSPAVAAALRKWPDLGRRTLRLDAAPSEVIAKFVLRYNEVFPRHVDVTAATLAPYDAFYLIAYAAASLGDRPITGTALGAAMARLGPGGERVDVGRGGIHKAFYALAAGTNIDLQGGQTSLDFDPVTGDPALDFTIYCASAGNDAQPPHQLDTGLVFRAQSRKLEGTFRCP